MYKLIGKDGIERVPEFSGELVGYRKLKIYGRLDCPSALRHIAAGNYVRYRVFFADEETALAAGYRPCGVCMKEYHRLWKEGRLMTHALSVTPVLDETAICTVRLANGEEKSLTTDRLRGTLIPDELKEGIEDYQMKIERDYCIIILSAHTYQWGYTLVWDYVQDKLVHLTNTPFAVSATAFNFQLINLYLIQYWDYPADLWYNVAPLSLVDSEYEPELHQITITPDRTVKDSSCCGSTRRAGSYSFGSGNKKNVLKNCPPIKD